MTYQRLQPVRGQYAHLVPDGEAKALCSLSPKTGWKAIEDSVQAPLCDVCTRKCRAQESGSKSGWPIGVPRGPSPLRLDDPAGKGSRLALPKRYGNLARIMASARGITQGAVVQLALAQLASEEEMTEAGLIE